MLRVAIGVLCVLPFLAGCSVFMAADANAPRDLTVLTPGMPRVTVLSELGTPVSSHDAAGERFDIFHLVQGRSDQHSANRAFVYHVAAAATLGLSEAVMVPLEAVAGDAGEARLKVSYETGHVSKVEIRDENGAWLDASAYPLFTQEPEQGHGEGVE